VSIYDGGSFGTGVINVGSAYEVGVRFTADAGTVIKGLQWFRTGTGSAYGVSPLRLWNWDTATELASVTPIPDNGSAGWQEGLFASPVTLSSGINYAVSAFFPNSGGQPSANLFGGTPTQGVHLAGNYRCYRATTAGFPASADAGSYIGVDVIVAEPKVRVTQVGTDVVAAGTPTVRVTQVGADVVASGTPTVRVTQIGADVVWAPVSAYDFRTPLLVTSSVSGNAVRGSLTATPLALATVSLSGAPRFRSTLLPLVVAVATSFAAHQRTTTVPLLLRAAVGLVHRSSAGTTTPWSVTVPNVGYVVPPSPPPAPLIIRVGSSGGTARGAPTHTSLLLRSASLSEVRAPTGTTRVPLLLHFRLAPVLGQLALSLSRGQVVLVEIPTGSVYLVPVAGGVVYLVPVPAGGVAY
jgi:hypothetical protein